MNQQQKKVLRMLKDAASRGVHTFELRAECIANPSQRVTELEKKYGCVITHNRERLRGQAYGVRYVLISEPGDDAPAYDDAGAPLLFGDAVGTSTPKSPFDESEKAA